jgi:hypothetical protein
VRNKRIVRWTATFLAAALSGLLAPPLAEQASAQAAAPSPAPAPTETATLERRRDELAGSLAEIDRAIAAATTTRDAARTTVSASDARLPAIVVEQSQTAEARVAPSRARQELAVEVYVRGDPRGRQYLDSLASGEFTLDSLRATVLFAAAEQAATARVAELDQRAADLRSEADRVAREREEAIRAGAAAESELAGLAGRRAKADEELAAVDRALRRALATVNADPLTGLPRQQRRPALAIKIDNHPDARPQSGLNEADVIFEELVEGGLTRFIAVYHSTDASPVGPVRSGRTSDLVILSNLNRALFGSSGGNAGVLAALRATNLASVIENDAPGAYYRDGSRDAPHNLYTRTPALYAENPGDAGQPPPMFAFLAPGEAVAGGSPVSTATVHVGDERVDWTWTAGGWQRSVSGSAESDAEGVPVRPTNVIVQFTDYGVSDADASSPEAQAMGSGVVWVLTGGRLFEGTWSRPAPDSVTQYLDAAGNEIRLNPGRTWISLAEPGRASVG